MPLSEKRISPTEQTEDGAKAILDAEDPKSVAEAKSFLVLAKFSSRFIPQATKICIFTTYNFQIETY